MCDSKENLVEFDGNRYHAGMDYGYLPDNGAIFAQRKEQCDRYRAMGYAEGYKKAMVQVTLGILSLSLILVAVVLWNVFVN